MKNKFPIFQKGSGISPYIWSVFSILPFYFIFQASSTLEITIGIILTIVFFISLRFAFISTNWPVYLWTSILIGISIAMTVLFQYAYFAFYIAYYNGNIKNRIAFITLYIIHLVSTTISINYNIVLQREIFLSQIPFIVIIWISVILLPFNLYNKKKQGQLEEQLEDAHKRISELIKQEERQRIARDLHDTLGQKLSLIGLKSDLARKLISKDPDQARNEMKDVQQTARTALSEVRKMVSQMRGIRIKEELVLVEQILKAAHIDYQIDNEFNSKNSSLYLENILSMCLKEAITNVVKHSKASHCEITISQSLNSTCITVFDNGIGINDDRVYSKGNGLIGIKERLEFVNGTLEIQSIEGTKIIMVVPHVIKKEEQK
ncbi:sensor histidine kinase [Litchfieldia alkalitelluris]|uniref:sensor histidine kinase n=1 Tax=Litchfieldia alkalitelluris TaxID=304268 RepID=UPI0009963DEF|nr:sensor histidine kinase [Litchfieldia alkalitelluris]